MSIVNLHAGHALNLPVHAFFRMRHKRLSVSTKDQIGKFLRRLWRHTTQADCWISQKPLHFCAGNQQHAVTDTSMPIDKKVIVISGVLGEHHDAGACLLRRRNDLLNRAHTVM